jgi:hypothetical protein
MTCGEYSIDEGDYIVKVEVQFSSTVTTAMTLTTNSGKKFNFGKPQSGSGYQKETL